MFESNTIPYANTDRGSDSYEFNRPVPDHSISIVLQPPISQFGNLASILSKVRKLFAESASSFEPPSIRYESTLRRYRDEAIALKSELLIWSSTQPETARSKTIERFTQPYIVRFPGVEDLTCPTTRADIYSDCE
jgi:hypothetical protein